MQQNRWGAARDGERHGGATRYGERTVVKPEFVSLAELRAFMSTKQDAIADILRNVPPEDIREDVFGRRCYRVITG